MSLALSSQTGDTRASTARLAAAVVSCYVAHNSTSVQDVALLIRSVFETLTDLQSSPTRVATEPAKPPVVPVKRSVQPDYIVCLEDGRRLKMLKRYLRTTYGLTPDQYRAKWDLPSDYPMVAPNYSRRRSDFAKEIGLGRSLRERQHRKA
jgi:predicted transcriptional regulator